MVLRTELREAMDANFQDVPAKWTRSQKRRMTRAGAGRCDGTGLPCPPWPPTLHNIEHNIANPSCSSPHYRTHSLFSLVSIFVALPADVDGCGLWSADSGKW